MSVLLQRIHIPKFTVYLLPPAAHHYSPLFFTSMLALLSPLLALHIENLERLKVNLDEIVNIHSDGPLPGMYSLSYIPELCLSKYQEPSPLYRKGDVENSLVEIKES